MKRSTVPVASVPCDRCPNLLLESEAALSRRALKAALCWRCRLQARRFPTVHQAPAGCVVEIRPSGYGLFECSLVAPNGQTFTAGAWTDHGAIARARAAAVAAGAIAL